jgi:glycine/D-amino acid oxidase-like deaminating enzyme
VTRADRVAMEGEADVVIIGGGIVGCATAYYLARRGLRPVLVEKERSGASSPAGTGASCGSKGATRSRSR